jgi:uncharacterized Fe-S cluster-containing radical SAM superfamily enzyme
MSTLGTLQIETTNHCNGKCVFCPVPTMKRKRGFMDVDLFKKIINDAVEMQPQDVLLFLNGEPFIDPHLFDRIAFVNEKLPHSRVVLYSNGNLLTAEKARELAKLRVGAVNFSVNAVTEEGRQAIMGLPLEEAVENILRYRMLDPTVNIAASLVMDPAYVAGYESEEFKQFFTERGIIPRLFLPGNWAGKLRPTYQTRQVCCRPTSHMAVLWDGRVALCCFDVEGEVILGDLNNETIKGVWNGERFSHYRTKNAAGERKDLELCGTCTTI